MPDAQFEGTNGLGYPIYGDGSPDMNVFEWGTGAATQDISGGTVQPLMKSVGESIGQVYATQLNPLTIMTVDSQGPSPALLMQQNPTGCNVATGKEYVVVTPIYTAQMTDIFGLPIEGAPLPGQSTYTYSSTPGNQQILGGKSDDPKAKKKLPFVAGFYPGEAIGQVPYGKYDFIVHNDDGTTTTYKAKDIEDPVVKKPEINVLYNHDQFFVDTKTNELNLNTHAAEGAGVYGAGANIELIPGAPPDAAPAVLMTAAASGLTPGGHLIAYTWSVKGEDGGMVDTDLSPSAHVAPVAGYLQADLTIPQTTVKTAGSGIKVWMTKVGEVSDTADFYLATTLTTMNLTGPVTTSLTGDDSTLTTKYVKTQTLIAVTPTVALPGAPPTDATIPSGTLGLGAWTSKKTLSGYTWDGHNTGAEVFIGLDARAPSDVAAVYMRTSDGSFPTSGAAAHWWGDFDKPPLSGDWPGTVSLWMNGSLAADGGLVTTHGTGTPTDTSVVNPKNGHLFISDDDDTLWWRSNDSWHQGGSGGGGGGITYHAGPGIIIEDWR